MDIFNASGQLDKVEKTAISESILANSSIENEFTDTNSPSGSESLKDQEVISLSKAHHHLLRLALNRREANEIKEQSEKIKNFILERLKINLMSTHLNTTQACIYLTTEYEEEIKCIANCSFEELSISLSSKILPNNQELDSRKVKISRPFTCNKGVYS